MKRSNQRGEGKLGLIVAAALVGAAIFAGIKYIPVRVTAYQFRDEMRQACRHGAAYQKSEKYVADQIMELADDLQIPLDKSGLVVKKTRSVIRVEASYDQPIDFAVTTYMYKFRAKEEAPLF